MCTGVLFKMKFVALVSGGKDSIFSIIKSQQYGHELVALANLMPPTLDLALGIEEMHSYMYQTSASSIVPAIAQCLDVPLIRQPIHGKSLVQSLEYTTTTTEYDYDEVEDLYILLQQVLQEHPEVQGVSCGAIYSTYQRIRLENICKRLNLVPLTYLWQMDRRVLLNEMLAEGLVAVLVKVSGAGLVPEKHLNKDLGTLLPTLEMLHRKYGLDLCGEGGEYESFVVDCKIYKKKIEFVGAKVYLDSDDASVGNLVIRDYILVDKNSNDSVTTPSVDSVLFEEVRASMELRPIEVKAASARPTVVDGSNSETIDSEFSKCFGTDGVQQSKLYSCPLSAAKVEPNTPTNIVVEQIRRIFSMLSAFCSNDDVVFVHLYLQDINMFGVVNEEYCKYFGDYPPSRCCVALQLPLGVEVALDVVVMEGSRKLMLDKQYSQREVLHVQSVSQWAPQCIGPYSQANVVMGAMIYVAGQIPLNPGSMALMVWPNHAEDCTDVDLGLCLRHAEKILSTLNSSINKCIQITVYVNQTVNCPKNMEYLKASIRSFLANQLDRLDSEKRVEEESVSDSCSSDDEVDESLLHYISHIPIIIIGVSGLPRNAPVEVEVLATLNSFDVSDLFNFLAYDTVFDERDRRPNMFHGSLWSVGTESRSTNAECDPITCSVVSLGSFGCFSSGVFNVKAAALPALVDSTKFAFSVLNEIKVVCATHRLHTHFIKSIRVYYNANIFVREDLVSTFQFEFGKLYENQSSPLIFLPAARLECPNTICSVAFLSYNLLQIKTEVWVNHQ